MIDLVGSVIFSANLKMLFQALAMFSAIFGIRLCLPKIESLKQFQTLVGAFEGFGPALLKFFESDNFDKTLELIQTIIAGMFAGGFNKIATDGLDIDLTGGALTGLGDMFKGITNTMPAVTKSLNSLSGTLEAMQN